MPISGTMLASFVLAFSRGCYASSFKVNVYASIGSQQADESVFATNNFTVHNLSLATRKLQSSSRCSGTPAASVSVSASCIPIYTVPLVGSLYGRIAADSTGSSINGGLCGLPAPLLPLPSIALLQLPGGILDRVTHLLWLSGTSILRALEPGFRMLSFSVGSNAIRASISPWGLWVSALKSRALCRSPTSSLVSSVVWYAHALGLASCAFVAPPKCTHPQVWVMRACARAYVHRSSAARLVVGSTAVS
jgi:hypothetical protein